MREGWFREKRYRQRGDATRIRDNHDYVTDSDSGGGTGSWGGLGLRNRGNLLAGSMEQGGWVTGTKGTCHDSHGDPHR